MNPLLTRWVSVREVAESLGLASTASAYRHLRGHRPQRRLIAE